MLFRFLTILNVVAVSQQANSLEPFWCWTFSFNATSNEMSWLWVSFTFLLKNFDVVSNRVANPFPSLVLRFFFRGAFVALKSNDLTVQLTITLNLLGKGYWRRPKINNIATIRTSFSVLAAAIKTVHTKGKSIEIKGGHRIRTCDHKSIPGFIPRTISTEAIEPLQFPYSTHIHRYKGSKREKMPF